MINIVIFIIAAICWIIIAITKPYCYTNSKFCTKFWIIVHCIIGGLVGGFGAQSFIYLCGGTTFLN